MTSYIYIRLYMPLVCPCETEKVGDVEHPEPSGGEGHGAVVFWPHVTIVWSASLFQDHACFLGYSMLL